MLGTSCTLRFGTTTRFCGELLHPLEADDGIGAGELERVIGHGISPED